MIVLHVICKEAIAAYLEVLHMNSSKDQRNPPRICGRISGTVSGYIITIPICLVRKCVWHVDLLLGNGREIRKYKTAVDK